AGRLAFRLDSRRRSTKRRSTAPSRLTKAFAADGSRSRTTSRYQASACRMVAVRYQVRLCRGGDGAAANVDGRLESTSVPATASLCAAGFCSPRHLSAEAKLSQTGAGIHSMGKCVPMTEVTARAPYCE